MCSSPNIPAPPPPPQDAKEPDAVRKDRVKKPAGMVGGTVLTGAGGIQSSSLNTGGNTLLGG